MSADVLDIGSFKKEKWKPLGNGLVVYIPTGIIYVRKQFRRHKIPSLSISTGETKIGRARSKAEALIQEHLNHYLHNIRSASGIRFGSGKTVASLIEEFLKYETPKKRRKRTQENHGYYFQELQREWGRQLIERVSDNAWADWLEKFRERKDRTTFDDYAVYMNMLLGYAYRKGYLQKIVKIPFTDEKQESGRVFTTAERDALWAAMGEETRDQFALSYGCGMRLREVLFLTWERVDLETGLITLRKEDVKTGSRTGKGRIFYATEQALARLRKRYEARAIGSPFVFPGKTNSKPMQSNKTAWIAAKRRAGIKGRARWHDLRHSAISDLLLIHDLNPVRVSEYCGVSIRTIQRVYLHSTAENTREVSQVLRVSSSNWCENGAKGKKNEEKK